MLAEIMVLLLAFFLSTEVADLEANLPCEYNI